MHSYPTQASSAQHLSIFELYSTYCSHHGSLWHSQNSHLVFILTPNFNFTQNCWPYIALVNMSRQLHMRPIFTHYLTTLPKHNPPKSCSDGHSTLTSSTCAHPVTKIYKLSYGLDFITSFFLLHNLSNIPFMFPASKIS